MSVKDQFCDHVRRLIHEATDRTGHPFKDLHELFHKMGVFEAVCLLMSPKSAADFTYGFQVLMSADLLHLSIEQAVLDFAHAELFTDEQISKARATLMMARMIMNSRRPQFNGGDR